MSLQGNRVASIDGTELPARPVVCSFLDLRDNPLVPGSFEAGIQVLCAENWAVNWGAGDAGYQSCLDCPIGS